MTFATAGRRPGKIFEQVHSACLLAQTGKFVAFLTPDASTLPEWARAALDEAGVTVLEVPTPAPRERR